MTWSLLGVRQDLLRLLLWINVKCQYQHLFTAILLWFPTNHLDTAHCCTCWPSGVGSAALLSLLWLRCIILIYHLNNLWWFNQQCNMFNNYLHNQLSSIITIPQVQVPLYMVIVHPLTIVVIAFWRHLHLVFGFLVGWSNRFTRRMLLRKTL